MGSGTLFWWFILTNSGWLTFNHEPLSMYINAQLSTMMIKYRINHDQLLLLY